LFAVLLAVQDVSAVIAGAYAKNTSLKHLANKNYWLG
jgi:hypothetical protein